MTTSGHLFISRLLICAKGVSACPSTPYAQYTAAPHHSRLTHQP